MAVYKGAAFTSHTALLSTRYFSAALVSRAAPASPADHSDWEDDAGTAGVTVVYGTSTSGVTPPGAPDTVTIGIYDGATLIDEVSLSSPSDGATGTLHITTTGTSGGTALLGNLRLRIRAQAGGIGAYDVNSESDSLQGYVRINPTTLTLVLDNGGAGTPHTWPDTQTATVTQSHGTKISDASRDYAVKTRRSDLGATYKSSDEAPGTGTTATGTYRADYAYPQASTQVLAEAVVSVPTYVPDSDTSLGWIKVPSGSGQHVNDTTLRTAAVAVDPRITVESITRTSSEAVVNFGLHTVGGTFEVHNARSEKLTSSDPSGDRNLTVKSRDVVAGANQSTISASLAPNGAGLYTLPSYSYSGPTSTGSRGTGPNGDTAAHDTSGRAKTVSIEVNAGLGANNPTANGGTTLVSLSDLLRLDSHPQKSSTLTKDTDPYATPGDGEVSNYTIGLDALHGFAFVGDVNGAGVGGVVVTISSIDPLGATKETDTRTTQSGGDLGWTTTSVELGVDPPPGTWELRVLVELDDTGAQGNYGDSAISPFGSLDQSVEFASAYTADKSWAIHVPEMVVVGDEVPVVAEYVVRDGATVRIELDEAPNIRVYSVNPSSGAQSESVAWAAMTQLGGAADCHAYTWTPSVRGVYLVQVDATYQASKLTATRVVTVRDTYTASMRGVLGWGDKM